jgi:hypothetical protein
MTRLRAIIAALAFGLLSAAAQLNGPGSTGVSASLLRLFGTNNTFTAQAELQVLGKDNKEIVGTPMTFTLAGNKIRVEVDLNRIRNRIPTDDLAEMKPLGLDQVVSIIRPETRTNLIIFPKLRAFVKLDMPPNEAEAFLRRTKTERTTLGKEKMEGYNCVKQRVVITDDDGQKSEATVWTAAELRNFPVCVATREKEGTVVVRFRKVQFTRTEASLFDPPVGFSEYADMQALIAGAGVKYMKDHGTALKNSKPTAPAKTTPSKSGKTNTPSLKKK